MVDITFLTKIGRGISDGRAMNSKKSVTKRSDERLGFVDSKRSLSSKRHRLLLSIPPKTDLRNPYREAPVVSKNKGIKVYR